MDIPIIPIVFGAIVIIIAAFVVGKRNTIGKKGSMVKAFLKPFEIYINLDNLTVGRLAGADGVEKKDEDTTLIRYAKGWMDFPEPDEVPSAAILRFHPPFTKMMEGVLVILPYSPNSPLANTFQMVNRVVTLTAEITRLRKRTAELQDIIKTGENTDLALQRLSQMTTILEKMQGNIRPQEKTATIIETAGIKESKDKIKPM